MNTRAIFLLLGCLLSLPACKQSETSKPQNDVAAAVAKQPLPANPETYASLLIEAEELRKAAADAGAEWLETGPLIIQARQAAEQENWGAAIAALAKARRQAELALSQAEHEAVAWKNRVIR